MLVAAPGHHPTIASKVDPAEKLLEVALRPVSKDHPPKRMMTGRVVDEEGKPVLGASVWITGASKDGMVWIGQVKNVDKVAFTDESGSFLLTSTEDYDQWELAVHARGFAETEVDHLDTGDHQHEIRMSAGVLLTGQVVRDGQPVPHHVVSISFGMRSPRAVEEAQRKKGLPINTQMQGSNERKIATDANGRFEFVNTIPMAGWYIHSDSSNDPAQGAFETEEIETGESGTTRDLGLFVLKPTCRLAGRVIMQDGGPVPPELRLFASLDFGRGHWQAAVRPDGAFEFPALPQDQIQLAIGREICRFVPGKQQIQQTDGRWLTTRIDGDREDLELVLARPPAATDPAGEVK